VLLKLYSDEQWVEVERTEVLRSCSSPVFSRVLALEYFFEEKQPLQLHVFDAEDGATGPSNDTFLGSTECTLGQIVSQTKVTKPLLLKNGKTAGKSTITVGKVTCTPPPWVGHSMPPAWTSMVTLCPGLVPTYGKGQKVALWVVGRNPATCIPLADCG